MLAGRCWCPRIGHLCPKSQLLARFLLCLEAFPLASGRPRSSRRPAENRAEPPAFRLDALLAGGGGPGQSARGPVPEMREGVGKAHSRPWGHRGQDSRGQVVSGHEVGCTRLAPGAHGRPQSLHAQRQPRGGGHRGALT